MLSKTQLHMYPDSTIISKAGFKCIQTQLSYPTLISTHNYVSSSDIQPQLYIQAPTTTDIQPQLWSSSINYAQLKVVDSQLCSTTLNYESTTP